MVAPQDQDMEETQGPKLSAEEFKRWKEERQQQQAAATAAAAEQRRRDILAGHIPIEQLTGRELAEFHPEVFEGY